MGNRRKSSRRKRKRRLRRFYRFAWRRFPFCQWCGQGGITLTIDHIMPSSKGGDDTFINLCLACGPCNQKRGNTPGDRNKLIGPKNWLEVQLMERDLAKDAGKIPD